MSGSGQQDYSAPVEAVCYSADRLDLVLAALIGLVVGGGWLLMRLPGLAPDAWQGACEVAWIRPAMAPRNGLWHVIASWMFAGGVSGGVAALRLLGPVVAGLTAAVSYLLLRDLLPLVQRLGAHAYVWRNRVERILVASAVLAFSFSAPMGRLAQAFTPDALSFLLVVVGQCLFLRFLQSGRLRFIYACAVLVGFLVAGTPFGLVLLVFWVAVWRTVPQTITTVNSRMTLWDPVVVACTNWPITLVFLLSVATGVALDVTQFLSHGGLAARNWNGIDLAFGWFDAYRQVVMTAATPLGAVLAIGGGFLPFFVTWWFLPQTTNEDALVGYRRGWLYLLVGVFALLQLGGVEIFRYLSWTARGELVPSPLLAAVLTFFSLLALVAALVTMGIEFFCRNRAQIIQNKYPDAELTEKKRIFLRRYREYGRVARLAVYWIAPAAVVAFAVVPRAVGGAREVRAILDTAMRETLAEAGKAKILVTDGSFDAGLELMSAAEAKPATARDARSFAGIHALSLYAPDGDAYSTALRLRDAEGGEDEELLRQSSKNALRTWVERQNPRVKDLAVQVGFEAWRRMKRPEPRAAGLVARPVEAGGRPAADVARDVAAAKALASRVLRWAGSRRPSGVTARERELLDRVQWRLARLARQRAAECDAAGHTAEAAAEQKLADELDQANVSLGALSAQLVKGRLESNTLLTPREGLTVALGRGDFALARRFASPVLVSDPEDPDANFAMGMAYLLEEQWARAEEHLRRVLKRRPNEPAVMNNIAAVLLKVGRYDEAEVWAKKALERLPGSTAVKNTLREIQSARPKRL